MTDHNSTTPSPENASTDALSQSALRALGIETHLFCQGFRLTPRESEIVSVLAEGVTRIKDIADRLRLSPNTVNNHVNSIFMKTKARSKSQLLAMLLSRIAEELQSARLLKRAPRLILVARNADIVAAVMPELKRNGFNVRLADTEERLTSQISQFHPDFILADASIENFDCRNFVSRICALAPQARLALIGGSSAALTRCDAMEAGAIEIFERGTSTARLATILLSHYIENDSDRARFLSVNQTSKTASQTLEIQRAALGRGGIFIPSAECRRLFGADLAIGDRLDLRLKVENRTLVAEGEVVWTRDDSARTPGAGVRLLHFDGSTDEDRETWRSFVFQNSGLSFIPTGESTVA